MSIWEGIGAFEEFKFLDCISSIPTVSTGNKNHAGPSNAVKLDNETEELKHEKLDLQVGKIIQQARNAKGITQVELARVSVSLDYINLAS